MNVARVRVLLVSHVRRTTLLLARGDALHAPRVSGDPWWERKVQGVSLPGLRARHERARDRAVALLEQFDRKLAAVTKARHLDRRAAFEQKWSSVAACVRSVRDDRVEAQRLALYWVQIWLDGVRRKGGIYDVGDIRGGVRTVAERWLAYAGGQPVDLAQMPDHLRATIRRKPPSLAAYDVAEHYAGPADDARRTRPRKQASNAPAVIRDALEPGRRTRPR